MKARKILICALTAKNIQKNVSLCVKIVIEVEIEENWEQTRSALRANQQKISPFLVSCGDSSIKV